MTPHSRSNHTYARTHERTSNPLSRRFLETPSRPVLSTAVPAPTGIRPRHKIFSQSTISPTTKKLHQTKIELLCDVTKPRFRHMASLHMLIHTHTLNQLQNKMGIKPTPGNPPEHDATQLRLHMTPHPFCLVMELTRLPVLVGFFKPIHTHTLIRLQNKVGTKPTPENTPGHGVTKLHLHMTPHPFLHTRV